jgi:hypothetical protein
VTPLIAAVAVAALLFISSALLFRKAKYDTGQWWCALGFRDLGVLALFTAGSFLF